MTRMTSSRRQTRLTVFVAILGLEVLMSPGMSPAQTTDITPSGLNTQVNLSALQPPGEVQYDITGGTRPGGGPNLFHSFGEFSVATDNIANFLNETALPTSNILSRVTSGNPSNIFGTIQTTNFGAANLYLINPAGVMFGPTAELNVGGSFAASTADYLKMIDGATFSANPAQTTVLSLAPVAAFGFLGLTVPQTIRLQGTGQTNNQGFSSFSVSNGKTLSLVGGDIKLGPGTNLAAPSGQINVVSVASAGEVVTNSSGIPPSLDVNSFTRLGAIQMTSAALDTSGNAGVILGTGAGGTVLMRGGQLIMNNGNILANTSGDISGAPVAVDIRVSGAVAMDCSGCLSGFQSGIETTTFGNGRGGSVSINAASVEIKDGAGIHSETAGAGHAGDVIIQATDHVTLGHRNQSGVLSTINTFNALFASGGGGTVTIHAPNMILDQGRIQSGTVGTGASGEVQLNVRNLALVNGGAILTDSAPSTGTNSPGQGGHVSITVTDSMIISGSLPGPFPGDGIVNSGIYTGTSGIGPGSGSGGPILISSSSLDISDGGQLSSTTSGVGNAGSIIANVGALNLSNGASISGNSTFTNPSAGGAGAITIQGINGPGSPAATVSLNDSTINTTIAGGNSSSVPAGIKIAAQMVDLANGAQITADTSGAAPAGNITLNVDTLTAGNPTILSRTISSSSDSTDPTAGKAGNITIQGITGSGSPAANVSLDSSDITTSIAGGSAATTPATITITAQTALATDTSIRADTFGTAPAGDITLNVDTLTAGNLGIGSGSVLRDTTAGNSGNITIQGITGAGSSAANVSLDDSTINTGIQGGSAASSAASITITAQTLALAQRLFQVGASIESDTRGPAPAGNITLNVDTLTAEDFSTISSGSLSLDPTGGNAGNITIQGITGSGSPAANVSLDSGVNINTASFGGSGANTPATITITARSLALANGATIEATTLGAAPAGNIALNVGTLAVSHPAPSAESSGFSGITSGSFSSDPTGGNAGNIRIQGITGSGSPAANVSLDRGLINTTIFGGGRANTSATITITAQSLALANGATIEANTAGTAPAGNIALNVGTLAVSNLGNFDSGIFSSSFLTDPTGGNAGNITIQGITGSSSPAANVSLDNSTISTTIAGGTSSSIPATIAITAHTVNLANGAEINSSTSGAGNAGTITIKAEEAITVAGNDGFVSAVASDSVGTGAAGSVSIEAPTITIAARGRVTTSNDFFSGRAGDVLLDGQRVTISGGGRVDSSTRSAAPGGTITINGTDSVTIQGCSTAGGCSGLETTTFFGGGPGGVITVNTDQLTLDGGLIQAVTISDAPAGSIMLTAQDATITGGAAIEGSSLGGSGKAATISLASSNSLMVSGKRTHITSTGSGGLGGDAGTVTILAPVLTLADGAEISTSGGDSTIASIHDTADAGTITVDAARVKITGAAFLDSSTFGSGSGGSVTIKAAEAITISGRDATGSSSRITTQANGAGNAGQITLTTPNLQLMDGANLSSNTADAGNAGSIQLNVGQLSLLGGTSMTSRAVIQNGQPVLGSGGSITVFGQSGAGTAANAVSLNNSRLVTSSEGSGNGGSIQVNANSIGLNNTALISATNEGTGNAGSVTLQLAGLFSSQDSTVSSSAAQGAGGNVSITAGNMNLNSGTTISAQSAGSQDAGGIALTSASDLLMRNSTVTTSAANASGGDIKLTAPNIIRLVDSTLSSSVQGDSTTKGGNINVDPQLVVIQNSQLLANANEGAGGNISIAATGAVLVDPNSLLSASAGPAGVSGSVNISAPIQVLSGALVPLNLAYSQAGLSGDRCAADPQGQFSSFVQTGRDGVPQVPGALSPSPLSFLEILTSGSLGTPAPNWAAARLGLDLVSFDDSTRFLFHSACRS